MMYVNSRHSVELHYNCSKWIPIFPVIAKKKFTNGCTEQYVIVKSVYTYDRELGLKSILTFRK